LTNVLAGEEEKSSIGYCTRLSAFEIFEGGLSPLVSALWKAAKVVVLHGFSAAAQVKGILGLN
jgi:hypothetical protein